MKFLTFLLENKNHVDFIFFVCVGSLYNTILGLKCMFNFRNSGLNGKMKMSKSWRNLECSGERGRLSEPETEG